MRNVKQKYHLNDERLYSIFTGIGHLWTTTAGGIKIVGHAWIAPTPQ